jgi:hypothetical protein
MHNHNRIMPWVLRAAVAPVLLFATFAAAQTKPAAPAAIPVPTDRELASTQQQLVKLLRLSPMLTTVIEHDPSLLGNLDYVNHNNPQLGQFLAAHPEVVRNPEFYLFTHTNQENGGRDEALSRAVWPELVRAPNPSSDKERIVAPIMAALAFACFLAALVWMIRIFLENRRWSRIFKLQSEVHGKLIDKFSSSQELALYMDTEAGKRFLEAAPIPVGFEPEQRVPNALARVLTPLQIGVVLVLLGSGLYGVRHATPETEIPLLFLSILVLMPGLGFIISAGITWVLAGRLGLIPEHRATQNKLDPPFDSGKEQ